MIVEFVMMKQEMRTISETSRQDEKRLYEPPSVERQRLDAVVKAGGNGSVDSPFGTKNEIP